MYKYFSKNDTKIQCRCGCGKGLDDMDQEFMHRLDAAREQAGVPFRITSGFRCGKHNNKVSSTGFNGPHTTGKAIDIRAHSPRNRYLVLKALIDQGFHRLGVARTFIHVDATDNDPEVIWNYD